MAIERIHWSVIPIDLAPPGVPGPCLAIWPAPVDHDECFAQAGFASFADTDDDWDGDFHALLVRLFETFLPIGSPRLDTSAGVTRRRWWKSETKTLTPFEALLFAAQNDQVESCTVRFGSPVLAQLTTSDGHPIVFAQPADRLEIADVLARVTGDLPLVRTELDWGRLAPRW